MKTKLFLKPEQVERLRQRLLDLRSELQVLEHASREDIAPVELDQAREIRGKSGDSLLKWLWARFSAFQWSSG